MKTLWRLSNSTVLASQDHPGNRWVAPGANVVLLHDSALAAICARLSLVEAEHPRRLPRGYRLMEIAVPGRSSSAPRLPHTWRSDLPATRAIGHDWLDEQRSLLMQVPGMSGGWQYLLNCDHPDMARCKVVSCATAPFSPYVDAMSAVDQAHDWLAKTPQMARDAA